MYIVDNISRVKFRCILNLLAHFFIMTCTSRIDSFTQIQLFDENCCLHSCEG